jgi:Dyp-type peroxidase family
VEEFAAGMAGRQGELQDPGNATWRILRPEQKVHGVFLVTGGTEAEVNTVIADRLAPAGANGWSQVGDTQVGVVRPHPVEGHEHFGYADGVSQPAVRGLVAAGMPLDPTVGADPDQAEPGRDLLWPGEFVFGYAGQDADDFTAPGKNPTPETPLTTNGAFLVIRRLQQQVPEFTRSVKTAAASLDPTGVEPSADLLGAQLVGRWKSGAPLINAPHEDDPSVAEGTPGALDFEFDGDRQGLVCPWAAHVRKAYPRDDVVGNVGPTQAAVAKAEAGTQTHRMMRRGIAYGPELNEQEALTGTTEQERGLLFACYVTDIKNQFEFVQKAWVNNPRFVQNGAGIDAIIGQKLDAAGDPEDKLSFTGGMPFNGGAKPELMLGRFVHMEGGEYFFAPSVKTINGLLAGKAE